MHSTGSIGIRTEGMGAVVRSLSQRLQKTSTAKTVRRTALRHRRVVVVAFHAMAVAIAGYLAFWLRFDGEIPAHERGLYLQMLPWLLVIRGLTFIPFRLYEGLWRYTGIWDLRNLLAGVLTSSAIFYVLVHGMFGYFEYPRSVFIMDALLLIFLAGGVRLGRRIHKELMRRPAERRVLIYGAGDAGEMVVRDMQFFADYQPIGFIDDDREKVGQRIHGLPVLGTRLDLPRIIEDEHPDEVLVAIARADGPTVRRIVRALEPYKLPITTVPNLRDLLSGSVEVSQIRPLSIEDLLPRSPVGIDPQPVVDLIRGKRVLVTGAGGSIGSELCHQIAALQPALLVLYERHENSLYLIENSLRDRGGHGPIRAVVGDVTDAAHLDNVLAETQPDLIFHAAAHKHVPLMEMNACAAVKNNVRGTRMVAEAARRHGVGRFVLISTDKAVNPSSVMGASKRLAEFAVQAAARQGGTTFVTVRFGNVLGSNGSVVLRFLEQIKRGGPVTVTHPAMRRYFMLIPEAVQLVLHAAALGGPGALYTLQMGDQLKLVDMARNLIRLSGYIPEDEIAIEFVGLRPGEKLSEELVGADETLAPSSVESILKVEPITELNVSSLEADLSQLEEAAAANDVDVVLQHLWRLVPTFRSGAGAPPPPPLTPRPAKWQAQSPEAVRRRRQSPAANREFADNRARTLDRRATRRGGRRLTDRIGPDPMLPLPVDAELTAKGLDEHQKVGR